MKVEEKINFENVWQLIRDKKFSNAEKQLLSICEDKHSSEESISFANYMIGCINSAQNNKDKDLYKAHCALIYCIESKYPHPMAYLKFADIQKDKNVAINYLKAGLRQFPTNPSIYIGLLKYTNGSEKEKYIDEIDFKSIMDEQLLKTAIKFLISENNWAKTEIFLQKVLSITSVSDNHKLHYTLLYSFSLIAQKKDIDVAKQNFKSIMDQDISNELKYSHHMGYLWCLINKEEVDKAVIIFDKIPLSMEFGDLTDGPWYPINMDFVEIYKYIFTQLRIVFAKDKKRKLKTDALEAYYLYTPSFYYDICRYEKKHINRLSSYLAIDKKNLDVACALFNMQVHFKQFFDAYCTMKNMLEEYLDPEQRDIFEIDFFDECTETEILKICDDINKSINSFVNIDKFMTYIFEPLISFIFESQLQDKYKLIFSLAVHININYLLKSACKFEIAYSYVKSNPRSDVAEKLYLEIIKDQPENESALNNVGVIYENRNDLNKAIKYYQEAYSINSDEKLYKNNYDRVHKLINKYEKALTAVKNENVWLLGKLNLIYINADLQGEFCCSYKNRAKLLNLSPQKANEIFNNMLKNGYIEKVFTGDICQANRYAINPLIKEYLATESDRLKRNEPYEEMANFLNYDVIAKLGYTQVIEDKIDGVSDLNFKEILKRDVKEAAIALAIKQYKSCIVMCGSIIEAILTSKIISSGYQNYNIGLLTSNKSYTKNVLKMDLNELLELSKNEGLINIGEYHLSNFVRCYRNIIHPSVEIRKNYDANENNARMMWNALLLIINQVI